MTAVAHLPARQPACMACGTACLHCAVRSIAEATVHPLRVVADDLPDFMNVTDVARRLAVSTRTVERLIEVGDIATVRIGRSVRIPAEAYRAYCEALT